MRRTAAPLYAAGFTTAFGAHAIAANLGGYTRGRQDSLLVLGLLLAMYDGAEGGPQAGVRRLADRIGLRPVLFGGPAAAVFAVAGDPGWPAWPGPGRAPRRRSTLPG